MGKKWYRYAIAFSHHYVAKNKLSIDLQIVEGTDIDFALGRYIREHFKDGQEALLGAYQIISIEDVTPKKD